jgi:hypothetical protein
MYIRLEYMLPVQGGAEGTLLLQVAAELQEAEEGDVLLKPSILYQEIDLL